MATVYRCDRCGDIGDEMLTTVEFRPPNLAPNNHRELCKKCAEDIWFRLCNMPPKVVGA